MKRYKFTFPAKIDYRKIGLGCLNLTVLFNGTIFEFIKKYGIIKFIRCFKFTEYKPREFKTEYSLDAYNDMKALGNFKIEDAIFEAMAEEHKEHKEFTEGWRDTLKNRMERANAIICPKCNKPVSCFLPICNVNGDNSWNCESCSHKFKTDKEGNINV